MSVLCLSPLGQLPQTSPRFYFVFVAIVVVAAIVVAVAVAVVSQVFFASFAVQQKCKKRNLRKTLRLDAEFKENCDICILIKVQEFPIQQNEYM